ncbi:MAG: histidine--tRNA ligase [Bacteroidetes bacterium]|nr:histidine--tRNA ligase [Bacteroidota bacterium]
MSQKPSIPKGTRDFSPQEMVRRNYIFDTIKQVFRLYGYLPIETPAMENLSTLMGKYGDEGDKLIFKILNSGNFMASVDPSVLKNIPMKSGIADTINGIDIPASELPVTNSDKLSKTLLPKISEKALKYDLTVPFARYVVQHQSEITFPFKRYQIQPVWRADRPQKGRYREFYQCDADVIGSNSLINEVELVQMIDEVFTALKIPVLIKINNRKILSGIAEMIGEKDKIVTITVAIDKLDKIGVGGVNKELQENGVGADAIKKLQPLIEFKGNTLEKLNFLKKLLTTSEIGLKGIEEIEFIFKTIANCQLSTAKVDLDITLARGLNYYTGAIFEVKVNDPKSTFTSSICGGGRYDDLTGVFGLPNMSGVGISFGADRIYDVLNELNLYPLSVAASTKLLFVSFGEKEQEYCLPLLAKVRKAGINSEIYPDAGAKMKKQMSYADDKKIPFVVIVGSEEMQSGMLSLKNMESGSQDKKTVEDIIGILKNSH